MFRHRSHPFSPRSPLLLGLQFGSFSQKLALPVTTRKETVRLPVETLHRAHLVQLADKLHVPISLHPRAEVSFS